MTDTKPHTLTDDLTGELRRNREILREHEAIGAGNTFAAVMLKRSIKRGEEALQKENPLEMLYAYNDLKDTSCG